MPKPLQLLQNIIPRSNRFSSWVLFAALVLPPLFFGSRTPKIMALWCAVLGGGLLLTSTGRLLRGHWFVLIAILTICAAYGVVISLQLFAGPAWISPNPVWAAAAAALNEPLKGSVSAVLGEPYFALGPPLANILAVTIGLIVGNNGERAQRAVRYLAYAGALYSAYGIVAHVVDPSHILWYEKTQYIESVTSTFVNRNTAATYFGSCAAIWLVLLLDEIRRRNLVAQPDSLGGFDRIANLSSRKAVFRLAMLTVCLSSLGMTNSRAGLLISITVLCIVIGVYWRRSFTLKSATVSLLGFVVVIFALLKLMGGGVQQRLDTQGLLDGEGRFEVYRSMMDIIQQHPWLGVGLGTFSSVFPQYRSRQISGQFIWDLGHNTYLEFASELGLPLTILCGAAWLGAIALLVRSLWIRKDPSTTTLAALSMSLLALAHSAIDFSLQIGGLSIVVFALLGVGLSQSIQHLHVATRSD